METNNQAQYIPALAGAMPSVLSRLTDDEIAEKYQKGCKNKFDKKGNELKKKPSLRFLNEMYNPVFSLNEFNENPIVLISAGSNYRDKNFKNTLLLRNHDCPEKETKVFVDSGGYQLLSGSVNPKDYTNEVALKWSEENGDIFPILDRPTGSKFYSDTEAEEKSIEAAKYYYENRKHKGEQILNVLQGPTLKAKQTWYNKIKEFEFDGWACGGFRGNNLYKKEAVLGTALMCLYMSGELEKENVKRLHLFGISSPDFIIYFNIIQNIFNKQGIDVKLTFDTTSFSMSGKFGNYWTGLSKDYGITGIHFPKAIEYNPDKSFKLPCVWNCPICEGLEDVKSSLMEYKKMKDAGEDATEENYVFTNVRSSSQLSFLITIHNLYGMLKIEEHIKNIISSNCDSTYKQVFGERIMRTIKSLRNMFDNTNQKKYTETDIADVFEYTGADLSRFL
jgi:queuine/archaeosine tRNA-ribosyltransferase